MTATISPCGHYRYFLQREFETGQGAINFVMLNPSTADETHDDNTIRRCILFAKREGAKFLWVTNLYAYRATNPAELLIVRDPIGPLCEKHVTAAALHAVKVVCAWGSHAPVERQERVKGILRMCTADRLYCLGKTANGSPKHPLYLPKDTALIAY